MLTAQQLSENADTGKIYRLELTKEEINYLDQLLLIAGRVDSHDIRQVTIAFATKLQLLLKQE